jgi:WhiB family redox-sensing transcriptional regulator
MNAELLMDWSKDARCRTADPDELFVQGAAQNRAKAMCMGCPVRTECLADALDNRVEFGVWGGMTERERRALLKRRPDVASWRTLLESARREHLQLQAVG